jgi:hypothetical protein
MTLKEKFLELAFAKISSEELRDECEQIAEDFAIEFAEWVNCSKTYYTPMNELLEIYKREKGL